MINSDKPHDYWQLFVHELYPNGQIGKKISKFVATVMNEDGQGHCRKGSWAKILF